MTPPLDDPLQSPSPQESDSEQSINVTKTRLAKSPLSPIARLPYRRSNASLSNIFASTSSLPSQILTRSDSESALKSPTAGPTNGSVFSPGGSTVRSPSPSASVRLDTGKHETRDLIARAFSPHISVLASPDTEELVRHKGIHGGLLELLRPFGERIPGKVTIRDSSGASRSYDDFAVRFVGVKDGLENPRAQDRRSLDSNNSRNGRRASALEYKPARIRSGGDVAQVEELAERHLTFAEEQSAPVEDYISHKDVKNADPHAPSPFYLLYLRRLLSGLPMVPSETFSHPVASVIAISSRSPAPIEELRTLYSSSNTGEHRLPQWVHNEFLRYYVLVHDEDYDDIQKSMALYDQMKRHFGLHCHLLRLRSTQCVPSDDDVIKLPSCEWVAAAEELAEIVRREVSEDDEDPTPCLFETDATAVRAFVREMVLQSIIPSMERAAATWNDQVASRRRGLSGRFMSLSKRFTTFGTRSSSSMPMGGSGSNYDSLQGFYRPDAPEAIMRKLADYAMMLRDYKLAQSTYEILCQDFKADKAWKHYAAANEMAAVSALIVPPSISAKVRVDAIDQYLEAAYYSYITRASAPYNALRTLLLAIELLKLRGAAAGLDDATKWSAKILEDRLVGPVGHVLIMERIALCFDDRKGPLSDRSIGERRRKSAFWHTLAADAWMRMEKASRAEQCLTEAMLLYGGSKKPPQNVDVAFGNMCAFLLQLQETIQANRPGPHHLDGNDLLADEMNESAAVEPLQSGSISAAAAATAPSSTSLSDAVTHRRSVSGASHMSSAFPPPPLPPLQTSTLDPLGAAVYETTVPQTLTHLPVRSQRKSSISVPSAVPLSQPEAMCPTILKREDDGFEGA